MSVVDWTLKRRPKQTPPEGDWRVWLVLAGRGFGKTRLAAEDIKSYAIGMEKVRCCVAAPTHDDLIKVCFEGESGLLNVIPPELITDYNKQMKQIKLFNGSIIEGISAQNPERFRGPQYDRAWCDELAAWRYDREAWDMLMMGLRLGSNPQCIVTTTPKPRPLIRDLMGSKETVVTSGTTYENKDNLADGFLDYVKKKYEGTRLGRQELFAEILDDLEGALFRRPNILYADQDKIRYTDMERIVVAVDPAVTANEKSDETGIIVIGKKGNNAYVLDDLSGRFSPEEWVRRADTAYNEYSADSIIPEVNQGGDMVVSLFKSIGSRARIKPVRAYRGKYLRAEPVAALYEQGRVFHMGGLPTLEDQMCNYTGQIGEKSPDRLDALVYGITELLLGAQTTKFINTKESSAPLMPGIGNVDLW